MRALDRRRTQDLIEPRGHEEISPSGKLNTICHRYPVYLSVRVVTSRRISPIERGPIAIPLQSMAIQRSVTSRKTRLAGASKNVHLLSTPQRQSQM